MVLGALVRGNGKTERQLAQPELLSVDLQIRWCFLFDRIPTANPILGAA
jgi:hypothetical protein